MENWNLWWTSLSRTPVSYVRTRWPVEDRKTQLSKQVPACPGNAKDVGQVTQFNEGLDNWSLDFISVNVAHSG